MLQYCWMAMMNFQKACEKVALLKLKITKKIKKIN